MGCGGSKAVATGGSAPIEKDAEDLHLEPLDFAKMKVPKFDDYLDQVEHPVNTLVSLSNTLNEVIFDVKDAAATLAGALKVDFKVQGSVSHDVVLISLTKADGSYPAPEDMAKLQKDAKVGRADADVASALADLAATEPTGLSAANGVLSGPTGPAMDKLNAALTELRTALGEAYTVNVVVKTATAPGAPIVKVTVMKPSFPNPDAPEFTLRPATLLDKAATEDAKALYTAEGTVAETMLALAKAAKDVDVSFSLKKKRLVAAFGSEVEPDTVSAVNKALSAANGQLFKLAKAAANANGKVSVARAIVKVAEGLREYVVKKTGDTAKGLISFSPRFAIKDGDIDFDLGLKINHPDFDGLGFEEVLDMLPGKIKFVWNAINAAKATVAETFPKFAELKEQVEELVDKVDEVFSDPMEAIKEAFPDLGMMDAMKLAASATSNVKKVADTKRVATTFLQTIKVLQGEFEASVEELKRLVAA